MDYHFVDEDGDGIRLELTLRSARFYRTGIGSYAGLPRHQAQELHTALGEWLYPTAVQIPAPEHQGSVHQRLKEMAEGLATAILPLSQAFRELHAALPETDPEPRDVGHPDDSPCTAKTQPEWDPDGMCDGCGYTWAMHDPDLNRSYPQCGLCKKLWHDGHGQPGDPCASAPKQLVGCECGHRWDMHVIGLGCLNPVCSCDRTPPRVQS